METNSPANKFKQEQDLALQAFLSSDTSTLMQTLQNAQYLHENLIIKTDLLLLIHTGSTSDSKKEITQFHRDTLRQILKILHQKISQSKLNLELSIIDNPPTEAIDISQF